MVFMMVMGYFVAKSNKSVGENLLRGFKIFVLGFLLNMGLNLHLLIKIKFADWPYNPLEYIFGVDILYLAGLSIFVLAAIKLLPQKLQMPVSFSLIIVVLFLSSGMNKLLTLTDRNYIVPFIGGRYSWSYFPLFPWLTYPLAGYFFFFAEATVKKYANKIRSIGFFTIVVVVVVYYSKTGFTTTINLPTYYHHTLKYGLWALAVLVLWLALLFVYVKKFKPNIAERFLAWMGRNITLIYVIQWLLIGNLATAIYQSQALWRFPLWLVSVLGVTLALSWLLSKTKIRLL